MNPAREEISVECAGGVHRIVLDRPPVNILTLEGLDELGRAVAGVSEDEEARAFLLTGRGRAFSAGVDVADHMGERGETMLDLFHGVIEGLLSLEVPVVVALNGPALGGGCELALCGDVVLARAGVELGLPETRLGVFPPAAVVLLPRLVGSQAALDLLLSGRTVEASEARQMGLVQRVISSGEFEKEADEYVERLASLSAPVLRLTKDAVRETAALPLEDGLRRAISIYRNQLMTLHDPVEGMKAFLQKRKPAWRDE